MISIEVEIIVHLFDCLVQLPTGPLPLTLAVSFLVKLFICLGINLMLLFKNRINVVQFMS